MKKIFTIAGLIMMAAFTNAQIIISEIYGGTENASTLPKNSYIILRNTGTNFVSLTGASIQYAPAVGAFTQYHTLPDLTLGPDQTYLIQEAAIANGVVDLPTPDFIATVVNNFDGTPNSLSGIQFSGTSGKIALAGNIVQVTGPTAPNVLDFIGYGPNADQYKGNKPAPSPTITTIIRRAESTDQLADLLEGAVLSGFVQNPFVKDGRIIFGTDVQNIKVFDSYRQIVKKSPTKFASFLDIEELPKGTYIVTGTINNVPISQKIVKD
ncbi:T9SS type A sorting domain-containing protein [Chryseobacterium pennipullorum]|uniref:Nuclease n=1 Tax=Chryseobacterium pennipullorum TaxID=2258963 RepID=A0A3D9B434_9FLAO|nr:T9SS type A sorting domain-containing protein [Chryseobacterium pennipullorum]REC47996.1 nuclease [Chryseobacterium pennipullorum]